MKNEPIIKKNIADMGSEKENMIMHNSQSPLDAPIGVNQPIRADIVLCKTAERSKRKRITRK